MVATFLSTGQLQCSRSRSSSVTYGATGRETAAPLTSSAMGMTPGSVPWDETIRVSRTSPGNHCPLRVHDAMARALPRQDDVSGVGGVTQWILRVATVAAGSESRRRATAAGDPGGASAHAADISKQATTSRLDPSLGPRQPNIARTAIGGCSYSLACKPRCRARAIAMTRTMLHNAPHGSSGMILTR
jgi:hypothetical protein